MRSERSSLRWYPIAVAAAGTALLFNLALRTWIGPNVFPPFLIAVLLCSRYGGAGPGLTATVVSFVMCCALLLTAGSPPVSPTALGLRLAMFTGVELLLVALMVARARADEALQTLGRAVEQSPASVVITDPGGAIEYVNPKFTAVSGYTLAEVAGKNPRVLKSGETPREEYRRLWETIAAGGEWRGEFHNRKKDGALYWELASISPVRDRRGAISHYVAVKEDITERKRVEQALRDSERRFRAMAETVPCLVWAARRDGWTTYFNRRWYEATGGTPENSLGMGWAEVLHPEDRERSVALWESCVREGVPFEIEQRIRCADGNYRWFLARGVPLKDDAGRVVEWFGTCTDIEDQKRTHAALAEAARAKDRFLAVLSHELRTPLTPVLMAVTAMQENAAKCAACRPTLEMIRANLEHEARLIDDLLDVARIARGELTYQFETVDLHALIRRAVEVCRPELAARGHRLSLDLAAAGHHVHGDPARLQQVVWNLLTNAVKYTPEGGRITVRTRPGGRGRLVVEVADDGVGIEPEDLAHLFDAFERGHGAGALHAGGLGLGLAISRSIAEAHGGILEGVSEGRGRGAAFTLELATAPAPAESTGPPSAPSGDGGRGLRILLAEDNAASAQAIAQALKGRGHEVTTATCLRRAMEAASGPIDLVVSDLDLGDGSGLELMRHVRSLGDTPGIALSGYATREDVRASLEAGFAAHLAKPVTVGALESAIRDVAAGVGSPR